MSKRSRLLWINFGPVLTAWSFDFVNEATLLVSDNVFSPFTKQQSRRKNKKSFSKTQTINAGQQGAWWHCRHCEVPLGMILEPVFSTICTNSLLEQSPLRVRLNALLMTESCLLWMKQKPPQQKGFNAMFICPIFHRHRRVPKIELDGHILKNLRCVKFLEILFGPHLKWDGHFEKVH